MVRTHAGGGRKLAYIAGGETVVHLTGKGLGGRSQELALAAAPALAGLKHCCVFSVGSDGTDGPTDAAGGYVDGETEAALRVAGRDVYRTLALPARTSTTWPWRWWSEHRGHAWFRRGSSGRSARSFGLQKM